jgi:hypothetical protein
MPLWVNRSATADMPLKASVYNKAPPFAHNWSGFDIGLNGGYSFGNSSAEQVVAIRRNGWSRSLEYANFSPSVARRWRTARAFGPKIPCVPDPWQHV